MNSRKLLSLLSCFTLLVSCSHQDLFESMQVSPAQVNDETVSGKLLADLPAPKEKIAVALYDFQDQTGQFRNNGTYTDYSSAVTKGGHAILTKALLDAGHRQWFTVTERGGLKDLLQERQIIKVMRGEYRPNGEKLPDLPPLVYGGMLIEGGIVSYDSNIITGGAGATYLGIGATAQYHRDLVTVYLRAISIQTGEVLLSVTSSKTIFSTSLDSNVLKYVTFDRLLQAEAGFSLNEPTQLGVRQAIETAVYSMIMEGAVDHLWDFKDPAAGQHAVAEYMKRRAQEDPDESHFKQAPTHMAMPDDRDASLNDAPQYRQAAPLSNPPVNTAPVAQRQPAAQTAPVKMQAPAVQQQTAPVAAVVAAPAPQPAPTNAAPIQPVATQAAQTANTVPEYAIRHYIPGNTYQELQQKNSSPTDY